MSTLHQLRDDLNDAWDTLVDGWHRLYRRAEGAITRYTTGAKSGKETAPGEGREILVRSTGWGVLAAEVFDDEDNVVVRLEAPGMDKDDFDLKVIGNHLVVRGEKRIERERTQGRYHVTECAYGRFERAIPLPERVKLRIPDEACHRFHSKAATHSTASLPLIPQQSCHRFR